MHIRARSPSAFSTRRRRQRSGFTLIEIMIAASALTIAMLGFSQALLVATRTQTLTREKTLATEACRRQIELIRSNAFQYIFRRFNDWPGDDVAGAGTDPGSGFVIAGLDPVPGEDAFVGEIVFPVTSAAPNVLREDLVLQELAMPRDLDLDGAIDATDHSADYAMIPVLVRARWRSVAGPAEVSLLTFIGDDE
jgi:prepilin-type N-terminal cleavage/methylation domain-containing protein